MVAPGAFSALANQLAERSPRALVSIAHIRKASHGVVALENCHPFSRTWNGQAWMFATTSDVVTILSTEPLTTDEQWQPFKAGESLLFRAGEIERRNRHDARPSALTSLSAERTQPPPPAPAPPPQPAVARG